MARWKLMAPHYLNVESLDGEPVEFIYEERSGENGRARRKAFKVPLLLDPKDPSFCNVDGEIVVSDGTNPGPRDYIILGPPTPDMAPLDDHAREVSASFESKWAHPIESLPSNGADYSQSLIAAFERQIEALTTVTKNAVPAQNISLNGIDPEEFRKMQAQMAELMAQNAELKATQAPAEATARR